MLSSIADDIVQRDIENDANYNSDTMRPSDLFLIGLIACITTLILTPAAGWIAQRLGILDRPAGYKAHNAPTPLLGGLGIVGGTCTSILLTQGSTFNINTAGLMALGVGIAIIFFVGLFDDMRTLSPRIKFFWQVGATAAVGLFLAILGMRLNLFLNWPPIPIILLTVLWIVGITNAVNFLDNMNGLCAGLGAIASFVLAAYNLHAGEYAVSFAAAALCGSCIGFLPFNWPRSRIFLGDAGSMTIGFSLASLSVMGVYTRGAEVPIIAVLAPLFILAIPVMDMLLVIILRLKDRHPLWLGDRRHISHRLVKRGMSPTTAVATLWAAGAASGSAALLLPTVGPAEAPLLVILLLCALAVLAGASGTRGLP